MVNLFQNFTKLTCLPVLLCITGCATTGHEKSSQSWSSGEYVAMGSSYAAGAQIGQLVADSPKRCGRTQNNYAHLLAARMNLNLNDVSCGGATTAHILGPWSELPPQIAAVTHETKLVTVTIGGNDLNYVRNLFFATCGKSELMMPSTDRPCPPVEWPSNDAYAALEKHLRLIAQEIVQRSPKARLVFIDYLRILPKTDTCAEVPIDKTENEAARELLHRMSNVTKKVANSEGALFLAIGRMSAGHEACSRQPWGAGHPGKPVDWHPTAAGHEAIARELEVLLQ